MHDAVPGQKEPCPQRWNTGALQCGQRRGRARSGRQANQGANATRPGAIICLGGAIRLVVTRQQFDTGRPKFATGAVAGLKGKNFVCRAGNLRPAQQREAPSRAGARPTGPMRRPAGTCGMKGAGAEAADQRAAQREVRRWRSGGRQWDVAPGIVGAMLARETARHRTASQKRTGAHPCHGRIRLIRRCKTLQAAASRAMSDAHHPRLRRACAPITRDYPTLRGVEGRCSRPTTTYSNMTGTKEHRRSCSN